LPLTADICRPAELGAAEVRQWHSLRIAAGLESPFLSAEYIVLVGELFPARSRVAVIRDGRDLVGFLPFTQHRFGRAAGFGEMLSGVQAFIPWGAPWSLAEVVRAAGIQLFEFRHLVARQYPPGPAVPPTHPLWTAGLADGYAGYLARVRQTGGGFIRAGERKRRGLERDDPDLRFEFGGSDLAAVRQLIEWKSEQVRRDGRWDFYSHLPGAREWYERLAVADSPGLIGSVSCLRSGDRLLAVSLDVTSAGTVALFNTAYDPQVASRSPGRVLMLKVLEAAAASGASAYHLGLGDLGYKRPLATGAIELIAASVGRPSLRTRMVRTAVARRVLAMRR